MWVETEHLIVKDLGMEDAEGLYEIKNDGEVMKFVPDLLGNDASHKEAEEAIRYFISKRDTGDFHKEICFGIFDKETGELAGINTVSEASYLHEVQIGWMVLQRFRGKGYASEAAGALSQKLMEVYQLPYMIVTMDTDNKASFRTAQKAGFRLFEKRVPYDYFYSDKNVENPDEVWDFFEEKQGPVGSNYYYFRKYAKTGEKQYYGDTVYTGRFA